jgi:hypothetical protein
VALGRDQPANWSRSLRVHLGVCLAAAAVTVVVTGALGQDDLEDWTDLAFWVLFAAMLSTAVYGGIRLLRSP